MSQFCIVRFNEQPTISSSPVARFDKSTSNQQLELPSKRSDDSYSPYDIFTAASLGDLKTVEQTLEVGFTSNRLNSSGWSALMYAAYLGHDAVCSLLLDYGVSIDTPSFSGKTALMLASACGNLSIVQLFIKKHAKIDQQDSVGNTALAIAVSCSHNELVEFLLESGANPNIKNRSGMTPTLTACSIGHELTLLSLLQYGGDVTVRNEKGEDGAALAADNQKVLAILKNPPQSKKRYTTTEQESEVRTLDVLFKRLNMDNKYYALFNEKGIDLKAFLKLNERQLDEIGVKAFFPKTKLMDVIEQYRTIGNFSFLQHFNCNEEKGRNGTQNQSSCERILDELDRVQKELRTTDNELQRSRKALRERRDMLRDIKGATEQSRKITLAILEQMKRRQDYMPLFKTDVRILEAELRELQKMLLKIPLE